MTGLLYHLRLSKMDADEREARRLMAESAEYRAECRKRKETERLSKLSRPYHRRSADLLGQRVAVSVKMDDSGESVRLRNGIFDTID